MITKKIIFILIIANIGLLKAQYTAIPDGCFEFQLIQLGIDSEGIQDGQILTTDIENIIDLDLRSPFCNIFDLTGIQDFTALETLIADDNDLTNIDISQNLNLKELRCTSNELISIDISNNLLLEKLRVPINQIETFISGANVNLEYIQIGNNNLANLDTSNFTNLKTFFCILNEFEQIDLSQNLNLEEIGVNSNLQLNFLDVRNQNNTNITLYSSTNTPNLTCVFVDDANYSTTNWLDIDPSITFVETELECETLLVNDFSINNISIYPNPAKDFILIENNNSFNIKKIKIHTVLGKEVITSTKNKIDISNLENGIYYINLIFEGHQTLTQKIIKK